MNFPFYIARRYLISKKSHNIIQVISLISVIGVAIGSMALIIVLSVFNGFDNLVVSLFSSFNAPLRITPLNGATFDIREFPLEKITRIRGVRKVAEVIETEALMKYHENQSIVTLKGVSPGFNLISGIDSMMVDGSFVLEDEGKYFTVTGYGIAANLNLNLKDYLAPITVYVPRRDVSFSGGFNDAFNSEVILPSGVFQIQYDYDVKYALAPLSFVIGLTGFENERTAVELAPQPGTNTAHLQKKIEMTVGKGYIVQNRYQQQQVLYQIMISEKRYIFLILTLILIIATFNVVGTLSMLILDKKRDIAILQSMGADLSMIRKIFLTEGMLISLTGAISGLVAGALICWLQMKFGFVRLGGEDSSFVVNAYPVLMKFTDFMVVFSTVVVIGFMAAIYPVYNIRKIDITMARGE